MRHLRAFICVVAVGLAAPVAAASPTVGASPTSAATVLPTVTVGLTNQPTMLPTLLPTLTAGPTMQATPVPTQPSSNKTPAATPTAAAPAVLSSNLFRPSRGPLMVSWKPLKAGRVTVRVYNLEGARVCSLPTGAAAAAVPGAWGQALWDGRDDQGKPVASGLFVVSVTGGGIQRQLKVAVLR